MDLHFFLKVRKYVNLCFFWSSFSMYCFGQASENDLSRMKGMNKLSSFSTDSEKVIYLDNLFFTYLNNDNLVARKCAKLQIELAERGEFKRGIWGGWMNLGFLEQKEGNYPQALKDYLKCLSMSEIGGPDISNLYINLAIVYGVTKEYDKSLEYNLKALSYKRKNMDTTALRERISFISAYNNIGMDYTSMENYQKSFKYYAAALAIAMQVNDKEGLSVTYNNMGTSYFKIKEFEKASEMFLLALKYAEEIKSLDDIMEAKSSLGSLYCDKKQFPIAVNYLESALRISLQLGYKPQRLLIYEKLVAAFDGLKDYKDKSEYLSRYVELNDSLLNEEKSAQLNSLRAVFETEEKEKENVILASKMQIQELQLTHKNYIVFGLCILFFVLLLAGWLLVKQNRIKVDQRTVVLEQKLLRLQMNPHFIFNSLTTIESFIYENQPNVAGRYLSDFARLIRLILENSVKEYISLSTEISTLDYYLKLQKLRLDDKLDYSIFVDPSLNPEEVQIPPMLTQPFIENSIEHGFRGSKKTGVINISFRQLNNFLIVEVLDNGIGINKAVKNKEQHKEHKSLAMQITKERLMVLNRSLKNKDRSKLKLDFSISDTSDEESELTGSKVVFSIPM